MSEYKIIGYITVGVEDTGDGLIIDEKDAKRWNLRNDFTYDGRFLSDGSYRIGLPYPHFALPPKITGGE